jgi:hypothetical protein
MFSTPQKQFPEKFLFGNRASIDRDAGHLFTFLSEKLIYIGKAKQ